jgi:hypothetical protein
MQTKDMKELIHIFNEHGVEYLLVGVMHSGSTLNRAQPKTSTCSSGPMPGIAMLCSEPYASLARPYTDLLLKISEMQKQDFRSACLRIESISINRSAA